MSPEREAELRRIASGEDWSPPRQSDLIELLTEIDALRAQAHAFQQQRDGVLGSIWLPAQSLAGLAAFQLADHTDDPAWNMANAIAHQLLTLAAGATGIDRSTEIQWGIRVHHGDPDGETSTSVMTGYTETGARHHARSFDHAEPVYRHLGPWLDAPRDTNNPEGNQS